MTTWVLVIMVVKFGGLYNSTPAVALTSIQGYKSEEECKIAAKAVPAVAWCIPGPR